MIYGRVFQRRNAHRPNACLQFVLYHTLSRVNRDHEEDVSSYHNGEYAARKSTLVV